MQGEITDTVVCLDKNIYFDRKIKVVEFLTYECNKPIILYDFIFTSWQ